MASRGYQGGGVAGVCGACGAQYEVLGRRSKADFGDKLVYEDAREALRPWAVYVVRYLQGEPGQMGRVRAIDRDLNQKNSTR